MSLTTVIVSPSLDRDAGRLLAAVLERVEPEVGEVGDRLAGRVHAEDAARVAGSARGPSPRSPVSHVGGAAPFQPPGPVGLPVSCAPWTGPVTQAGCCVWFTGLSGAGKSTIATSWSTSCGRAGRRVELLDGDEVREHLSKGLGFSKEDRDTNIRRIGFVASLLARNGVVAVTAAISPYRAVRDEVRGWIDNFVEVHVATSLEDCEARDVKGLYAKARAGEIPEFTGVSDPYEPPLDPEIRRSRPPARRGSIGEGSPPPKSSPGCREAHALGEARLLVGRPHFAHHGETEAFLERDVAPFDEISHGQLSVQRSTRVRQDVPIPELGAAADVLQHPVRFGELVRGRRGSSPESSCVGGADVALQ